MSTLTTIIKHTAIYSSGSIATSAVGFILLPIYTSYLSPADYGILELLNVSATLIILFAKCGLQHGFLRHLQVEYKDDEQAQRVAYSTVFYYNALTSGLICLLLISIAEDINLLAFPGEDYTYLIQLTLVRAFLFALPGFSLTLWQTQLRSALLSSVNLGRFALNLGLNIYFIVFAGLGLAGVVWGSLVTSIIFCVAVLGFSLKYLRFAFEWPKLKSMLAYGAPLMANALFSLSIIYSDRYFLQWLSNTHELGLYALSFKISMVLSSAVLDPFWMVWPNFYFTLSKEPNGAGDIARYSTSALLGVAGIAVVLSSFCRPMIEIMAKPPFWPAYLVAPILIWSIVLRFGAELFSVSLHIKKRTDMVAIFSAVALVSNMALNLILIPRWGAVGAAAASCGAHILLGAVWYLMSHRHFPIPFEIGKLILICLSSMGVTLFAVLSDVKSLEFQLLFGLLYCLGFGLSMIAFRVVNMEDVARIKSLVKSKFAR